MDRIILHVDMDSFFAQIEEVYNPQFRGKPIVVGADPKDGKGRGVVSTANYLAREYGIHSAMPISQAYRLCPSAIFLPVNGRLYTQVSGRIMSIIQKFGKEVEQVSLDEAYVDLSNAGSFKDAEEIANRLKQEILKQEKLQCTIGIGPNKMIAKIACEKGKPNGLKVILPDQVEPFFNPLSIEDIPGIGPKTAARLEKLARVHDLKVQDLKRTPKEELVKELGVVGEDIFDRIRGIDETPVSSEHVVKSIGKEYTFDQDTRDPEALLSVFNELIEDVFEEISSQGFSFKAVTVVMRFSGFETHTKSKTLERISKDKKQLKSEAMKLFLKFLMANPKPVRLLGIRVQV